MFETIISIISIIVGIFVCAGNALIFFIIFRQIRRVPSVQHDGETLRPISRAKVWSNEWYYIGSNEIFHYNGNTLISSHPIARITRVEKSSLKINNTYVWDIHIRDNGKYYIFSFRPNNKHFGDWFIQFRQAHPDRVHGKWSRWF
ncbi:hypothetical protein [Kingella oralis]|jgi:hypothetical protein|uniref:hypothetical protein n=1 Tax=Kingella oralis TaxID=505 RepID=UPI0034E4F7D2